MHSCGQKGVLDSQLLNTLREMWAGGRGDVDGAVLERHARQSYAGLCMLLVSSFPTEYSQDLAERAAGAQSQRSATVLAFRVAKKALLFEHVQHALSAG